MIRSQAGQSPGEYQRLADVLSSVRRRVGASEGELHRRTRLGGIARARGERREKIMDERGWRYFLFRCHPARVERWSRSSGSLST